MKTPEDKKVVYMIISVIILAVVYWIITLIFTSLLLTIFGMSLLGAMMSY